MPSNKRKSKKKKPPASAKAAHFSPQDELDPRVACKQLPAERQTKFVQDYCRAVDLLQEAKESLASCPYAGRMTYDNDGSIDCLDNLHACACLIQAFPLKTDMRLPAEAKVFQMLPGSSMSSHVTCDAHQVGHASVVNMGMRRFLVMLVDAIQMIMFGQWGMARLVIHELEAQLDGNCIDFEELESDPDLHCGLTQQDVEFALAVLGVKVNKRLYRLPPEQREQPGSPFQPPSTEALLADCRRFSERLNQIRQNMAWVEIESRNLVEAHGWFEESVKRADAQENDVVKCTSRIEYAGSIVWGSGAYSLDTSRVNRKEVHDLYETYQDLYGELEDWNMGAFAKGEPSLANIVKGYLGEYPEADTDGTTPAIDPQRIYGSSRDAGEAPKSHKCDGCGERFFTVRKCSGCKKKSYCGKECQMAHWKNGHKEECKTLRNAKK